MFSSNMAVLTVFLSYLAVCFAQNFNTQNWTNYNRWNLANQNGTGKIYGEGANIERPCEIFDMSCIRLYFAKNANCKKVYGTVKEPYYRPQTRAFLTNINVTLTLDDVEYRGLNGRIQEFYVNRQTDRLVLAVEFRNVYTGTDHAHFKVHRRAREAITTVDYLKVLYSSITVTIIVPEVNDLQLDKGESFSYVADGLPRISVGPKAFASSDSTVQRAGAEFWANIPISVREAFLTEGSFLIVTYIQNTLCDFGLRVL